MIKRATTILFILFANLVLLAHAVVPHHHHIDEVCIEESNCHSESESNEHDHHHDKNSNDDNNNCHEHESNSGNCILNQALVIPPNQLKPDFKLLDSGGDVFKFHQLSILVSLETIISKKETSFRENPIFKTKLSDCYLGNSHSLRAPPIV